MSWLIASFLTDSSWSSNFWNRKQWVSTLLYVLYTLHRDRGKNSRPLFPIVSIIVTVPVPFSVWCSVYEPFIYSEKSCLSGRSVVTGCSLVLLEVLGPVELLLRDKQVMLDQIDYFINFIIIPTQSTVENPIT